MERRIRIDDMGEFYQVRLPKDLDRLNDRRLAEIQKMSKPQLDAFLKSTYAAAVYDKSAETDRYECEWEEVLDTIKAVTGLDEEWIGYIDQEVKRRSFRA